MAGLIAGVIALLAILFLLPCFYYLPKAVLSAIIFVAVLSLLAELPEDLHFIFQIGAWKDLALLSLTFIATMIVSLEFGTLIAVTLSLLLTIKETSYPRISIMVRHTKRSEMIMHPKLITSSRDASRAQLTNSSPSMRIPMRLNTLLMCLSFVSMNHFSL